MRGTGGGGCSGESPRVNSQGLRIGLISLLRPGSVPGTVSQSNQTENPSTQVGARLKVLVTSGWV